MCAGAGRRSRFRRKVPEASGEFRRVLVWVPEVGSIPEGSGEFRRQVPEGSGGSRLRSEVPGGCWCKVPEAGSGGLEFRRVPDSSGWFWRWCRFRRQVPEGSGEFRRVPVKLWCVLVGKFRKVPVGSGRLRQVPASSGAGWCRLRRQVPEGFGACWCRFRRQGSEGSREFRCGNRDRSSHVIVCFEHWLVMTLSKWAKPLRKKDCPCI